MRDLRSTTLVLMTLALPLGVQAAGEVVYVSGSAVYLDLGRRDGVSEQSAVQVLRGRKLRIPCRLKSVADRTSVCEADAVRPGDRVDVRLVKVEAVSSVPASSNPSPREIDRRRRVLASVSFTRVEYHREADASRPVILGRAGASLSHTSWMSEGRKSYQHEEVSLSVSEAETGVDGLTASLDLFTWIWTQRPDTARFRPGTDVQVYVTETALRYRPSRSAWDVRVGRIRPGNLPGMVMLDGLEAGYRLKSWDAEVGLFGGVLPDIVSLVPHADTWSGGAYFASLVPLFDRVPIRQETRIGVDRIPGDGIEAAFATRWSGHYERLVAAGFEVQGSVDRLDFVSLDMSVRPIEKLRITADGRIDRHPRWSPSEFSLASRRGSGSVGWEFRPWIELVGLGGWMQDQGGDRDQRSYAGPEVRFPGLLGPRSRVTAGGQKEFGWLAGWMGYVQLLKGLTDRVHASLRGSFERNETAAESTSEWGTFASLRWELMRGLAGRLFLQYRDGDGPRGAFGGIDLTGRL